MSGQCLAQNCQLNQNCFFSVSGLICLCEDEKCPENRTCVTDGACYTSVRKEGDTVKYKFKYVHFF